VNLRQRRKADPSCFPAAFVFQSTGGATSAVDRPIWQEKEF
jgi:hypothetical protein